ncbi:MAG TPA: DUF4249 family protein [Bacteroidota bacterium]|nr:DUF4249 family protein [Bacteroidota bacterium]
MRARKFLIALSALALWGCDDSFNPVLNYRDDLVVFSVLSTTRDTHFVRVYATYNPPNYDPFSRSYYKPVDDAQVVLNDNNGMSLAFRDTMIQAWDTTRYGPMIRAHVIQPFVPVRGRTYTLTVTSPSIGNAFATVTVPGTAIMALTDTVMLRFPQLYSSTEQIVFNVTLSSAAKGFMLRGFIDYEIAAPVPGGWLPQRIELPRTILKAVSIDTLEATYPSIQIRTAGGEYSYERMAFGHGVYKTMLGLIWRRYEKPGFVRMQRVVFHLYQVEPNLFNYLSVANGFRDQFSVRTDEPDFSNISGGVGVFGAFAVDSVAFPIPTDTGYR